MTKPIVSRSTGAEDLPAGHGWRGQLVSFLPLVRGKAARAFQGLSAVDREEAAAEVVADVAVGLARLEERGRPNRFVPALAEFAVRHYRAGRRVGSPANRLDALSPVPRDRHRVVRLESGPTGEGASWRAALPDSRKCDPADLAAARIDLESWLARLPARLRDVALALADGETPGELARRLRVSPGRISQFRSRLRADWAAFQGEPVPA